ncbi:MAG: 2-oxoacid:acceptor oxidoreductase family protein [Verrucomicrobiota bacterium]|jgi:2-oxoglutarate ferredoxin oxidoreductase subunit gamma
MPRTEIRIGGLGGQGVILCGMIIGKAAALYDGKHATLLQSFGPEARGSACSAQVTLSEEVIGYPYVKSPGLLILLSLDAARQFVPQLKAGGLVLYENELIPALPSLPPGARALGIPATRFAEELGRRLALNVVMVGFFAGVSALVSYGAVEKAVLDSVPRGTEELNLRALRKGHEYGLGLGGQGPGPG